jgi:alkanesulfonate monooxygenase SsuD/methylene tetrahydromethanopterin reductase-like flavin-dependent oxidoreductase (luciferase family)
MRVCRAAADSDLYPARARAKVVRIAAALGEGIIYTGEVSTLAGTIATLKQCCAEVGRSPSEVKLVYRIPCSIAEKSSEAREEVKGKIARTAMTHLGRLHKMGKLADPEDRKAVERLWQHYDTYHHMGPEHSHLVRDAWVERFAVANQMKSMVR